MPELPKRKVGLVSCSGEEMPEGTITRLATLKVLETLRPDETVTICLPLFLAGGEGDRAFARFYPTIAIDGCEKRCAARGTEMHSGKPTVGIVVTEMLEGAQEPLGTARRLSESGMQAVDRLAGELADQLDRILRPGGERDDVSAAVDAPAMGNPEQAVAACSCGSGVPVQTVAIDGRKVTIVALPLIFERFRSDGRLPGDKTTSDLMDAVRIYNSIPPGGDAVWSLVIAREYDLFCSEVR
jgi:DGC domain